VRNKWVVGIAVLAVVVLVAGIGYSQTQSDSGSSSNKPLVIVKDVQRMTLQDSVTLNGTLARKELREVTAISQGRVSAVYAKDGAVAQAGARLFALDGRDAIAEPGDIRFFRPLDAGDRGDDVLQLKRILLAAGHSPGPMNDVFTEQTRFALAQWQAQHHYPGAIPRTPQTVTVSLGQGSGYEVGAQSSAGLTIPGGGATARLSAARPTTSHRAQLTAFRGDVTLLATPVLKIQSTNSVVSEGTPATYVITSSEASTSDIVVNLGRSGTATNSDVVTPPSTVTLAANTTSVQVSVPTRVDTVVKPKKTLTLSLQGGSDYSVGSPSSATTTITNTNVPKLRLSGSTTISAGWTAKLTVTADQAPLNDTLVSLQFAGDATPGTDYQSPNPVLRLRAGQTSASVTVHTLPDDTVRPNRHIVATISPNPASYSIGSQGSAVITVTGVTGEDAKPIVTLRSGATYLAKGQPYLVDISLDRALSRPLTIVLAYGGNAQQGRDFTLPAGQIVVPAGQTAAAVQISTVQDNVVESNRVLIVALAANSAYRIGSPNTAQVTIKSEVVPELTLTTNSTTVAGGGAATFTITADQAPVKNTSVNYQVVGTAQPGQDFEPLVGTAILKAGQTSVNVVLRSIQKDVTFQPTDMIVAKWPVRVGQVFVEEGDPVPPGTAVLSLTDPNFTVTLQASATDRTKLKVGQHCTVQLVGGTEEQSGTISQLDDNLTALEAAQPGGAQQQVYEGEIQVGDLGAADGASVTIKVIVKEVQDAITVPIAAVKQNGSGEDVVRVIDLEHGGKVTEVKVQTGLTEGSYIEVSKGLKGNESVIVETDEES
jgi:hypothetical protein